MVTHSSILAWKIPWTEEPCGLQFMGLQRVGNNQSDFECGAFMIWLISQESPCLCGSKTEARRCLAVASV